MDGGQETNGTTNGVHQTNGTHAANGQNGATSKTRGEKKSSTWQQVKRYWSYISVEPVMFCWLVPSCIALIAVQNLELQKVMGRLIKMIL